MTKSAIEIAYDLLLKTTIGFNIDPMYLHIAQLESYNEMVPRVRKFIWWKSATAGADTHTSLRRQSRKCPHSIGILDKKAQLQDGVNEYVP